MSTQMAARSSRPTSSFEAKRISPTTFLVVEDDVFHEHPYIYVKIHPKLPVVILSDTGCDEPSQEHKHDRYIHLREWLENCPVKSNDNRPLNPKSARQYIVVCTHCHYDHTGGIMHFLKGGTTEIVASAAGRDFIESDLARHGEFSGIKRPAQRYTVTKWAQAFERLQYPILHPKPGVVREQSQTDLGIMIIQTPGHTPDELAWYDTEEKHLYVGDSFYYEGTDRMPVIWPKYGDLVEWAYSMQKLQTFVASENARLAKAVMEESDDEEDEWVTVAAPRRVKVSCAHQTTGADGEKIFDEVLTFFWRVVNGDVPVVEEYTHDREVYIKWRDEGEGAENKLSFLSPGRLVDEARTFFAGTKCLST